VQSSGVAASCLLNNRQFGEQRLARRWCYGNSAAIWSRRATRRSRWTPMASRLRRRHRDLPLNRRWRDVQTGSWAAVCTCASWIWPQLVHLMVQCSKPERAGVTRWTVVPPWHRGQPGNVGEVGSWDSGTSVAHSGLPKI